MSSVASSRRAVALTAALAVVVPVATTARASNGPRTADGVVARADATTAVLGNATVSRTWSLAGGSVRTTALNGAGRQWVT